MKTNEENYQAKGQCCRRIRKRDLKVMQCDKNCIRRSVLIMIMTGLVFTTALVLGYFIEPLTVKLAWMILMGLFVIMTGITIYLLVKKTVPVTEDYCCSEKTIKDLIK